MLQFCCRTFFCNKTSRLQASDMVGNAIERGGLINGHVFMDKEMCAVCTFMGIRMVRALYGGGISLMHDNSIDLVHSSALNFREDLHLDSGHFHMALFGDHKHVRLLIFPDWL